jgi:hypothetical protein
MKTVVIIAFLISLFSSYNLSSQSLYKYSHIKEEKTNCEIARMIANIDKTSLEWPILVDDLLDEYYDIIRGTSGQEYFDNSDFTKFKEAFLNTFPTFYSDMLSYAYCESVKDRKLLILLFYEANGFYITEDDTRYIDDNFTEELFEKIADKYREYRFNNMKKFGEKLMTEYNRLME